MHRTVFAAAVAFAAACPAAAAPEAKDVKVTRVGGGRIEAKQAKEAPAAGYLAGQKELDKLWKAWGAKGKAPKVDFDKQLVLVFTAHANVLGVYARLDAKGDLTPSCVGLTALRTEDLGYVIGTVPRAGVKTVKGKKIAKD